MTIEHEASKKDPSQRLNEASARLPRSPFGFAEALTSLAAAPPPSALFEDVRRGVMLPEAAVRTLEGVTYGDFRVVPIFLDSGWRGVPGAVYNKKLIGVEFPDYLPHDTISKGASAISEAARNVAQHGAVVDQLPPLGSVCFAPGAIFLREFGCVDALGREQKFLLCMVSDEGMGIADPSQSLLPGVGSSWGEDHNGMGYELGDSVLMLIRARERGWQLFDGLHHQNDDPAQANAPHKDIAGVSPLAELQLPANTRGCQKIFIFQHPHSDAEAVFRTVLDLIDPLRR